MSLASKAKEIKAAGEERRGDYNPKAGSLPVKMYNYWAKHSKKVPERENFCHYWRVVVFWSGFMALRRGIVNTLSNPFVQVGLAALAVFLIVTTGIVYHNFGQVLLLTLIGALGLALAVWGGLVGVGSAHSEYDRERLELDFPKPVYIGGWILGLPAALILFLGTKAKQFIEPRWKDSYSDIFIGGLVACGVLFVLAIVANGLYSLFSAVGFWTAMGYIGLTLLAIIVVGGLLIGLIVLIEGIKDRLRAQKYALTSYEETYYLEHGEYPPLVPKRVNFLQRGLGHAFDFLVLAFQVVRVKKWKICPIVTIPTEVDKT